MKKKQARLKRAKRARNKIRELEVFRLTVHRTPRHVYAQVISADGAKTIAAAATVEKSLKNKATGNIAAASAVGKLIGERALKAGIKEVAFDRSGFKYFGRVKALAEAAREAGLQF